MPDTRVQEPRNTLVPFRRDRKSDFAAATGPELRKAQVLQALLTRGATPMSAGELPWRTAFGAGLDLLRHQRNDIVLAELARVHVRETLRRWVPEVDLLGVDVERQGSVLQLVVRFQEADTAAGPARIEEIRVPLAS